MSDTLMMLKYEGKIPHPLLSDLLDWRLDGRDLDQDIDRARDHSWITKTSWGQWQDLSDTIKQDVVLYIRNKELEAAE